MTAMVEQLATIFERVFSVPVAEFSLELNPESVAKWDSLGHMTLVGELEKSFNLEFDIDEVMEMVNVQKIMELVQTKRK
jgi:acyl carrier protein